MRQIRFGLILVLFSPVAALTAPSSWAAGPAETGARDFAQNVARSFFEKRFEYEQLDGEVTLVENGEARCAIVIPATPAPPVEFAAHEIRHYLDRITGAEIAESLFDDIEKSSMAIARAMPEDERYIPFPPARTWSDEFIGPATLQKYRQRADDLVRLTEGTRHERAAELISRFLVGRMEIAFARAIG